MKLIVKTLCYIVFIFLSSTISSDCKNSNIIHTLIIKDRPEMNIKYFHQQWEYNMNVLNTVICGDKYSNVELMNSIIFFNKTTSIHINDNYNIMGHVLYELVEWKNKLTKWYEINKTKIIWNVKEQKYCGANNACFDL